MLFPHISGYAQEEEDNPVYIVVEGDTLWSIAIKFGVSLEELQQANNLGDSNQINIGDRLIIPGLEGVQGVIVTKPVRFGESLRSLSRRYQLPERIIERLNHLTSPTELFAGSYLVVPEKEEGGEQFGRALLAPEQSILELAVLNSTNPWNLTLTNQFTNTWQGIPGDVLFFHQEGSNGEDTNEPGALPEEISAIELKPLSPLQGKVAVIDISASQGLEFNGSFMGQDLNIFSNGDGQYVGLQGIHAMAEPGVHLMQLHGSRDDGTSFAFSQLVLVKSVNYPFDRPLTVDPSTIDPAITRPEDAEWIQLATPATPDKMWDGNFSFPSPLPEEFCLETLECFSSRFGNRRSYNGGLYNSFHTGLDFFGGNGTEIYAAAPGVVVFAGPMTVRGNATMITPGWGVYTAYTHQEEIYVHVGEKVEAGQLIGIVGGSGRVEGPHLHWEVIVGGIQVDPLDWLQQTFP